MKYLASEPFSFSMHKVTNLHTMAAAALHSLSHIAFTPIIVMLLLSTAVSQDPFSFIPSPTIADCSPRLMALMPCAPFVQGKAQIPAQSCCDNLNQLYSLQRGCLRLFLNDNNLSAFPINRTLALQLPLLCKLQTNTSAWPGVPSLPDSQVSLGGADNNASVAASPMENPFVPMAPRPIVMGLGLGRSDAGRLKKQGLLTMLIVVVILLTTVLAVQQY